MSPFCHPINHRLRLWCGRFSAAQLVRWTVCALLLTLWGCAARPPLQQLNSDRLPLFTDDLDRGPLLAAARHQLHYLHGLDPQQTYLFGEDRYSARWLGQSMELFIAILETTPSAAQLNRRIHEQFTVYQATGREEEKFGTMLVTGYYVPLFAGSPVRKPPYLYPLYTVPDSLVRRKDPQTNTNQVGRYDLDHTFVPFWTRAEIENHHTLAGNELVYLSDPVDAFLLHVQGSGRIRLPDGTIRSVRYAGSNGHEYMSIGKLLVDERVFSREEVTVPAIRRHLDEHPHDRNRILQHNPRFIFFRWGDSGGPRGSLDIELTAGRSIAIDQQTLPAQAPAYLVSRCPVTDGAGNITGWTPLHRFVLPQDSGSAIKGAGRVDLFWGHGPYAEIAASHMKEEGRLFFLVKKRYSEQENQHRTDGT